MREHASQVSEGINYVPVITPTPHKFTTKLNRYPCFTSASHTVRNTHTNIAYLTNRVYRVKILLNYTLYNHWYRIYIRFGTSARCPSSLRLNTNQSRNGIVINFSTLPNLACSMSIVKNWIVMLVRNLIVSLTQDRLLDTVMQLSTLQIIELNTSRLQGLTSSTCSRTLTHCIHFCIDEIKWIEENQLCISHMDLLAVFVSMRSPIPSTKGHH